MSSIFSKIIAGEIPSYKIYEDDKTYAFLDIRPETKGHTLVVPKVEVDKIYDLDDENYMALMMAAKKVAKHMEEVLGARVIWKIVGTEIPHAHIHLEPLDETWFYGRALELSEAEMKEVQEKLAF